VSSAFFPTSESDYEINDNFKSYKTKKCNYNNKDDCRNINFLFEEGREEIGRTSFPTIYTIAGISVTFIN